MATKFPDLFTALAAEFDPAEVKTRPGQRGVQLRYITARSVMYRLDDVLGPENWWDEFEVARDNSTVCKLSVRLPDGQVVTKQGLGVTASNVGEDAEKGGESDALKRAAVKFGVGRYLYPDSIPHEVSAPHEPQGNDSPELPEPLSAAGGPAPRSGKALYAWAREQQEKHDIPDLIRRIQDYGKRRKFPDRMIAWSADETADAYSQAVRHLSHVLEHRERGEALLS